MIVRECRAYHYGPWEVYVRKQWDEEGRYWGEVASFFVHYDGVREQVFVFDVPAHVVESAKEVLKISGGWLSGRRE